MKLEECYALFEGDYTDVKKRLVTDERIEKYIVKFLSDKTYIKLDNALKEKNYSEAFRAVHTLKGISYNFSFDRLSKVTEELTETLRKWEDESFDEAICDIQWQQLSLEYQVVVEAIKQWRNEQKS